MDTSREAIKGAALTISRRRHRVRGCRIVIQVPVLATQGANRADLEDSWPGVQYLVGPRRQEAAVSHLGADQRRSGRK
jgi:hypothetical protein